MKPKWTISEATTYGTEAVTLAVKYTEMGKRLKPNEIDELRSNVALLKNESMPGQQEKLTDQKSKTKSTDQLREELHTSVIDVRDIVKAAKAPGNILTAFGVGQSISKSVSGAIAAGKIILDAYDANKEWANNAGVIDEDTDEIGSLINALNGADDIQENAKIVRQGTTTDKDALQRRVEDLITKVSALGAKEYRKKNPAVAKLFEDLIPPTHKPPKNNNGEEQK